MPVQHWLVCSKWDHHPPPGREAVGEVSQRADRCESAVGRGMRRERWNRQMWNIHRALKHCTLRSSALFFSSPDISAPSHWEGNPLYNAGKWSSFWRKAEQLEALKHQERRKKKKKKKENLKSLDFNTDMNVIFMRNKCHAVTTSESNLPWLT